MYIIVKKQSKIYNKLFINYSNEKNLYGKISIYFLQYLQ